MGGLAQILPWLKSLLAGGGAQAPGAAAAAPAPPMAPPPAMAGPTAPPPQPGPLTGGMAMPAGQSIADLTGAEAGPDATGPTGMAPPPPPATPTGSSLQNYAAVMKALQGIDTNASRPNNVVRAPQFAVRGGKAPVTPGPGRQVSPTSVGASIASPAGKQLIAALQSMMQNGGPPVG